MTQLKMLSADQAIAEIRRLYFGTTRQTIERDLERALDLLKAMPGEDERERATVFMEGLAEMRKDWLREPKPRPRPAASRPSKPKRRALTGGTASDDGKRSRKR